ncbi:hypothetical protein GCM10009677_27090 [Sphaerisporangium rubeum]|uniref:Catechol 2,3-dioxygenase-like lactoylglutathione lyase family enzyme n=1 Tax=Sphaerisporangium rubeum TaxID=321317 RepID=A0A7X0ICD9_9ACTN|nr:VOC family protein [Sphaerisporangium rubeum]MBB6472646.1 catechol 2,3-dioxygenase-like lactoylglutathione lyase family enzyme [Sphaerisporangium rubeum]
MDVDLFVGIPVSDYAEALKWYERLLGVPPAFFPHETEAVWELAEHRYVYVVRDLERAGSAVLTVFFENLDVVTAWVTAGGLEPAKEEKYGNGVRKVVYRDPDGNEIGFGGGSG